MGRNAMVAMVLNIVVWSTAGAADRIYHVVEFGAKPDGKTLCTEAIQKAVDACAEDGGGIVRLSNGTFLSGALRMRSGVTLEITERATLLGSRKHEDYYAPQRDQAGNPIEDVTLENITLGFEGGGTLEDAIRKIPERETSYPESTMFGKLPAYGFYCRHAKGLTFRNLKLETEQADLRHAMVFDDVQHVAIDGLDARFWPGAAAMLRMMHVENASIRRFATRSPVDTFLRLEGDETRDILLKGSDFTNVKEVVDRGSQGDRND